MIKITALEEYIAPRHKEQQISIQLAFPYTHKSQCIGKRSELIEAILPKKGQWVVFWKFENFDLKPVPGPHKVLFLDFWTSFESVWENDGNFNGNYP